MTDRLKEGQHSIHSDPMLGTLAEGAAAKSSKIQRECSVMSRTEQ